LKTLLAWRIQYINIKEEREEKRKKKSENMKYSETCQKYIGQNKNFEKFSTNYDGFQESKANIKACWKKL